MCSNDQGPVRNNTNSQLDVYDVPCKDWDDFRKKVNDLILRNEEPIEKKEWVFRGVLKCHALETTLERARNYWGEEISFDLLPHIEVELIREIERKAFGLGIPLPNKVDNMWWVSLMQHYGAPTRLLDFTYSPYVAAYFAFEKLLGDQEKQNPVIWAIQHEFTETGGKRVADQAQLEKIRRSKHRSLDFLFDPNKPKKPSVMQVNAHYLHDRITVQQGIFLCPTDTSRSFMDNFDPVYDQPMKDLVKRFILPRDTLKEAVAELLKMNISRQSLFPGIGGLAESLSIRLPYFSDLAQFHRNQRDRSLNSQI